MARVWSERRTAWRRRCAASLRWLLITDQRPDGLRSDRVRQPLHKCWSWRGWRREYPVREHPGEKKKRKRAHLVNSAQRKYLFFFLISEITVALSPTCWTSHGEVDRALLLSSPCAHSGACEEEWLHTLKPTHPPPTRNYNQVLATLYTGAAVVTLQHPV